MRKWIRGWNPRGKDGTWEDGILVKRTGHDEDGVLVERKGQDEDGTHVERTGQGRMECSWKGKRKNLHVDGCNLQNNYYFCRVYE